MTLAMNTMIFLRITQAVLGLIVLALASYCVDKIGHFPEAAFLVFSSLWSWMVLLYLTLTPMYFPDLLNRWVVVGLESTTVIFWFSGFIALANSVDTHFKCFGSGCGVKSAAQAAAAFGGFSWVAWVATLALIIHALINYPKSEQAAAGQDAGNSTSPRPGADIEMAGGQQQQQQFEVQAPELPLPAHFPMLQQVYGHPPSSDDGNASIPDPADFGGYK